MHALAADMTPRRERLARRAAVIDATPELAERELWKLRTWATALTTALEDRGADPLTAATHVEVALALFRTAFTRWIHDPDSPDLAALLDQTYAIFRTSSHSTP